MRVLSATSVSTIEEPTAPAADVNIYLPPLSLVRNITERLNKLASISAVSEPDRVILSANMSGEFKMAFAGPEARVESKWRDLQNPVVANSQAREDHPSTVRDQEEFVEVRVDGKEWAKVLKVSTLGRKAVACFCDDLALVLYVFLSEDDEEDTILTYYMSSYSA